MGDIFPSQTWNSTTIIFQTTPTSILLPIDTATTAIINLPANGGPITFRDGPILTANLPATVIYGGSVTVSLHQTTALFLSWQRKPSSTAASSTGSFTSDGAPTAPLVTDNGPSQTSSTISSTTSKPLPGSSPGVSPGAVAGTAIGCLLGGALLAGLILWFCWAKRKTSSARDHEANQIALVPREKGFSVDTALIGNSSIEKSPLSGSLPLPLEDKAITGEISKISNLIKNHVQSYYHTSRVSPGVIDFDDVQALGSTMPVPVGTLSTLLSNAATREIALRFCIAWVACSRMLLHTDPSISLLPFEVAGCAQSIAQMQKTSPSNTALLARWRIYTAELLQNTYVKDAFKPSDTRSKSIQEAIRALDNVLQPYADSRMDNEQRRKNLEEMLKRCALFAFTLFSQPSTWDFDWKVEQGGKSGELCVFPALVQLIDEHGKIVRPPRQFSEAVVRKLDG